MSDSRTYDGADDKLKSATYVVMNDFHRAMLQARIRQLIVHRTNSDIDPHMTPVVKFGVEVILHCLLRSPQGADGITLLQSLPLWIRGHRVTPDEKVHILRTAVDLIAQTGKTATKIKEDLVHR